MKCYVSLIWLRTWDSSHCLDENYVTLHDHNNCLKASSIETALVPKISFVDESNVVLAQEQVKNSANFDFNWWGVQRLSIPLFVCSTRFRLENKTMTFNFSSENILIIACWIISKLLYQMMVKFSLQGHLLSSVTWNYNRYWHITGTR